MSRKSTDVNALTITIDADGTATLSGINHRDLRSLLTAATLFREDNKPKAMPLDGKRDDEIHRSNLAEFQWYHEQSLYLRVLAIKMKAALDPHSTGRDSLITVGRMDTLYFRQIQGLESEVRDAEKAAVRGAKPPGPATLVAKALRAPKRALLALTGVHATAK